jgi:hypothetical protein
MSNKLSKSALAKLDRLCEAAQTHGWERDRGHGKEVVEAAQNYDKARGAVYDLLLQQQQRLKSFQTQSKQQPVIFAPGTKVVYQGKVPGRGVTNNFGGRQTIICEVSLNTGEVKYATFDGAWFSHADFIWVADPTPESLEKVLKYMGEVNEEDYDD